MAIAALHLRSRNTGKTMHPTISQSKISLSPFPRSFWSFSLSLFLWCTTLVCASLSNQIAGYELQCRSTMIEGREIAGYYERNCAPLVEDKHVTEFDNPFVGGKRGRDHKSDSIEPDRKRLKPEGQTGERPLLDPGSTPRERKDGETEASDDLSVDALTDKSVTKHYNVRHPSGKRGRDKKSDSIEPDQKRLKPDGQTGERPLLDPGSTPREWKYGETEASDDFSVDAFTDKYVTKHYNVRHPSGKRGRDKKSDSIEPDRKRLKPDDGETKASDDLSVDVGLEIVGDGEYVLKIKRIRPSSTDDDSEVEVERAKKMAQNAAMLLLHGDMLQEMGEKLLAQSRASFRSMFRKPAPPISKLAT